MAWLVRRGYWGFDGGFVPVRLPIRDMGSFLGIEDGTGRGYFQYVLGMFPKRRAIGFNAQEERPPREIEHDN